MFKKQKSVPEKIVDFVGDQFDEYGPAIAKGVGSALLGVAIVGIGASAIINGIREGGQ